MESSKILTVTSSLSGLLDFSDELIVHALSFLENVKFVLGTQPTSKRMAYLCSSDVIWHPICLQHWKSYYRGAEWTESAEAAYASGEHFVSWKEEFLRHEQMLTTTLGMFAMPSRLRIGESFGMHWFEPRYRWLAARCSSSRSPMCYMPGRPQEGSVAFICTFEDMVRMPDGRANVELLPVCRCVIKRLWTERVPDNPAAPPLNCAQVKELPLDFPGGGRRSSEWGGDVPGTNRVSGEGGGENAGEGGEADDFRGRILQMLFAHAEAHGIENMADLLHGDNAAPRALIDLLFRHGLFRYAGDEDGNGDEHGDEDEAELEDEAEDEDDEDDDVVVVANEGGGDEQDED